MRRALLTSGLGVAAVRIAGMGAGFALTVVLARVLGAEGLGAYAYAVTLLVLVSVPVNNGWSTVLLRATARQKTDEWGEVAGLLRWGVRLALSIAAIVLLALAVGALAGVGFGAAGAMIFALAAVAFFDQLSGLRLAVLRGLDHPVWGQLPEMLLRPALILGLFLLARLLFPEQPGLAVAFGALVGASCIAAGVGGIILWRKAPRRLREVEPAPLQRAWFASAAVLAGNSGLVILNTQVDFLILGALGTAEDLGHYRVAMQIAVLSGFAYTALNMIAMQRFAADGTQGTTQATASFLALISIGFTLTVWCGFYLAGAFLIDMVFGAAYLAAFVPALILIGVQLVSAFCGFSRSLLVMRDLERLVIRVSLAAVSLNLTLSLLLIPLYGVQGAAMSSFIGQSAWNGVLVYFAWRRCAIDTTPIGMLRRAKT